MPTPSGTTPTSTTLLPGTAPIGVILEADPIAWDASNTPLTLVDNTNTYLMSEDLPAPEEDPLWTSNRDMDGEALVHTRHRNRRCTWRVRVHGDDAADLQERVVAIEKKIDKLRREGGTIQRTLPSNHAYFLEVVAGTTQCSFDRRWVNTAKLEVTIELTAKPYWHGGWATVGTVTETTLPCAIFDTDQIPGSVPALGRLVVANTSTADQEFAMWGLQSRTYDDAATAGLFYEAEDLTPLGDATVGAAAGASGGDAIISETLPVNTYAAILSTGELTHTGDYRVWARYRPTMSSGVTTSIALEWATGDFRKFTRNAATTFDDGWNSYWRLIDLGLVHIPADEPTWEGRIIARTDTAVSSGALKIDCLFIMPVTEGYGEATGLSQAPTATAFEALDEFDQAAGALAGETLPIGGDWAGVGDTTDFTLDGAGIVTRDAVSDSAARVEYANGTDLAGVYVGTRVTVTLGTATAYVSSGVVARFVDNDNWLAGYLYRSATDGEVAIVLLQKVAGSLSILGTSQYPAAIAWGTDVTADLAMQVGADGTVVLTATIDGGSTFSAQAYALNLADTGALETGAVGLYDYAPEADARESSWDTFYAYAIPTDPAIFAAQNLEIRHDRVVREHSTGSALTRVSRYAGDYLLVPSSAGEARSSRLIVKASRGNPSTAGADWGIDDLTCTLYVRPRFIHLPE